MSRPKRCAIEAPSGHPCTYLGGHRTRHRWEGRYGLVLEWAWHYASQSWRIWVERKTELEGGR